MNTVLDWKKGIFSCNYRLLSEGKQVGNLKDLSLKRKAIGKLEGKTYEFRTYGLLKSSTEIFDIDKQKVVGKISFNCWSPEAKIQIGDQVSHWGFTNILQSKWGVFSEDKPPVSYQGWTCKGSVNREEQEGVMVLAGLYISNYFWSLAAIYASSLMPLFLFVR